ncbi:hypothetical protein J2T16_001827 [Paenibacillus intestini]|nr:hypothetical protein [Paenibacillus intestini]
MKNNKGMTGAFCLSVRLNPVRVSPRTQPGSFFQLKGSGGWLRG